MDARCGAAADLLTAELSQPKFGVALLERADIERIRREQDLNAGTAAEAARLGQTLGAHGVVMLELLNLNGQPMVASKLIAVQSGVALSYQVFAWPLTNATEWASGTARHLPPLLAKLSVSRELALPVSVLNLRAPIKTRESARLERDATALLIQRLVARREVFVLERQRLAVLDAEKELKDVQKSPFWNGSYLLEGVVEQGKGSRDAIAISARLVSPQRTTETVSAVNERGDLAQAVEQLAQAVVARLGKVTNAPAWDPVAEARRYRDEARWGMKWGAPTVAQEAADAAWALGDHSFEIAMTRVKSYLATAPALVNSFGYVNGEFVAPTAAPSIIGVRSLNTALNNFALLTPLLGTDQTNSAWTQTGLSALGDAASRLGQFWYYPEQAAAAADDLAQLRATCREVELVLVGEKPLDAPALTRGLATNIWNIRMGTGWSYAESLDANMAELRGLFASSLTRLQRQQLIGFTHRWLMPWSAEERTRASAVWKSFVEDISRSTNAADALAARLMDIRSPLPADESRATPELAHRQLIAAEQFVRHRDELLCQEPELVQQTRKLLQREVRYRNKRLPGADMVRTNIVDAVVRGATCVDDALLQACLHLIAFETNHLNFILDQVQKGVGTNSPAASQKRFFRAWLANPHMFRPVIFEKWFRADDCTPQEAVALLKRLDEWRQMDLANRPEMVPLIDKQIAVVRAITGNSETKPSAVAQTASAPKAAAVEVTNDPAAVRLHWWQPTFTQSKTQVLDSVAVIAARSLDAEVWAHVYFKEHYLIPAGPGYPPDYNFIKPYAAERFYCFEPETRRLITSPDLVRDFAFIVGLEDNTPFAVLKGTIYVRDRDMLLSWRKGDAQWKTNQVSLPSANPRDVRMAALGERLYIGSQDAVLEFDPARGVVNTMASRRRNPPVVAQDQLASYGTPLFFVSGTSVGVSLGRTIHLWDPAAGKWTDSRAGGPAMGGTFNAGGVLYTFVEDFPGRKKQLRRIRLDGVEEILFGDNADPFGIPSPRAVATDRRAKWPGSIKGKSLNAADGTNVWALDWNTRKLALYQEAFEEPLVMDVAAEQPESPLPLAQAPRMITLMDFTCGSSGLSVLIKNETGFWFAQQSELNSAMSAAASRSTRTPRKSVDNLVKVQAKVQSTARNTAWADEGAWSAAKIMRLYDTSGDGALGMNELARAIRKDPALKAYTPIIEGFQWSVLLIDPYDTNHNGRIDVPELEAMLKADKPKLTQQDFLKEYDLNGDGKIDSMEASEVSRRRGAARQEEFRARMKSRSTNSPALPR